MRIQYDEKQNIEFKESWRDEYLKWLCGFANAQGGTLYIGVNDKADVVGIENARKLLEDIPNKVRDALGIMVDVNLLEADGKNYLQIQVEPYKNPVSYKGEFHYRSGSTKQELKGNALTTFLLKKWGLPGTQLQNRVPKSKTLTMRLSNCSERKLERLAALMKLI